MQRRRAEVVCVVDPKCVAEYDDSAVPVRPAARQNLKPQLGLVPVPQKCSCFCEFQCVINFRIRGSNTNWLASRCLPWLTFAVSTATLENLTSTPATLRENGMQSW
jgi:hypothetical protein